MDDILLFVNFHRICWGDELEFPGLHHIDCARFEAQIDALSNLFNFPEIAAVELALLNGTGMGSPSCVLTFDDGLADHHRHVLPILERHNIQGIFTVNTAPWIDGRLLSVHRAHLLSAAFSYLALAEEFERAAVEFNITQRIRDVSTELAQAQYRYDDSETAQIKYFLNATIPQEARGKVLARVFEARLGDDRDYARRHYMSPPQVRDLAAKGHTIGLHTHRHLHLSSAAHDVRVDDLHLNQALLSRVAGSSRWISYPYGGPRSYNDEVVALAQAVGCRFGLTMFRAFNGSAPDPMRLSRVDNNDVVGGKRPLPWSELFS